MGKTCLIKRFFEGEFYEGMDATIGAQYYSTYKKVEFAVKQAADDCKSSMSSKDTR